MTAAVTTVLSTYGRPDTLACAVRSVLHQTMPDWRLLIIGDSCGEETAAALAPFLADERIRYVNLPWRCGDQAPLNAAGMACAGTDLIALLNHDDLWLPTHLTTACRQLSETNSDFFIGRSAWLWTAPASPGEPLIFETISPLGRDLARVFNSGFHYVEPASAWVFSRVLARKVGPWRRSADLFRPAIQDWALRAWHGGARVTEGVDVTCLKFENQWSASAPTRRYDTPAHPQQAALALMHDPAALDGFTRHLRQLAQQPQAVGHRMGLNVAPAKHPQVHRLAQLLMTPQAAHYFQHTGLDAYTWLCAEMNLPRGWRWRAALQNRTGEAALEPPPLADVMSHVAHAVADQGWGSND
ncbi:MAG: glycosyltransferase family A protein [Ottowia sp.]|uniref:glycosyltransferase family 2 protein n=1 Tax=Ottowia sp. TaxID=1898956 RepID=UPI0039E487FE